MSIRRFDCVVGRHKWEGLKKWKYKGEGIHIVVRLCERCNAGQYCLVANHMRARDKHPFRVGGRFAQLVDVGDGQYKYGGWKPTTKQKHVAEILSGQLVEMKK